MVTNLYGRKYIPPNVVTPPTRAGNQLPNPVSMPGRENTPAQNAVDVVDRSRFPSVQGFNAELPAGVATSQLILNTPSGQRVYLSICNIRQLDATVTPALPDDGNFDIGVAFDLEPLSMNQCHIVLRPGGAVLFDQTVPQNRVYLFVNNQSTAVPLYAGVVVANFGG